MDLRRDMQMRRAQTGLTQTGLTQAGLTQAGLTQAGFTMVELLVTAFILAIGLMGLSMLQVMSLRASRGGRSLSTGVQVADKIMDQIEMEGRLTWLNATGELKTPPAMATKYINTAGAVVDVFTVKGQVPDPAKPVGDPLRDTFFTVSTQRSAAVGGAPTGALHDYAVTVTFTDAVNTANAPITRTVTLTRRIVHG